MTASEQLNIVFYKLANDSAAVLAPKSLPTAAPTGVPVAGQASTNKAVVKSYPKKPSKGIDSFLQSSKYSELMKVPQGKTPGGESAGARG